MTNKHISLPSFGCYTLFHIFQDFCVDSVVLFFYSHQLALYLICLSSSRITGHSRTKTGTIVTEQQINEIFKWKHENKITKKPKIVNYLKSSSRNAVDIVHNIFTSVIVFSTTSTLPTHPWIAATKVQTLLHTYNATIFAIRL